MFIRHILPQLVEAIQNSPAVARLGPRQSGKTMLALKAAINIPSIYLDLESERDSGMVHGLLSHMVPGRFYRSSGGAEIDLLLTWPSGTLWAIEIKRSLSPKVERGFRAACADVLSTRKLVVYRLCRRKRLPNNHWRGLPQE